jgi:4-hydroxythreonine-4-phosphate dehydrogenase
MDKPFLAVTMGDPAGIGPEIAIKALSFPEIQKISNPVIIGDAKIIKRAMKVVGASSFELKTVAKIEEARFSRRIINVLDLNNVDMAKFKTGKISIQCGRAAVEYIFRAIELAKNKEIKGIVTCPINKEAIRKAGFKYQGHTEILADKTNTKKYAMMFVSDTLWVVLATTHLPLRDVSKALSKKKILETIFLTNEIIYKLRRKKPKIGVAGLNPHAGEGGIFGNEEKDIIKPAVDEAKKQGINVQGPLSPDAIFYLAKLGMFDIVVAMYHDQGLIPLKLLSFNRSVNVTLGLPIIRTSVDHGTGFDIAGKGWANPQSLIQAIKVATHFAKVF